MTIRLGGPLVGALAGLAAAAVAAVLVAGDTLWTTLAVAAGGVIVTAVVAAATGRSITPKPAAAPEAAPPQGTGATSGAIPVDQLAEPARAAQATADRTALVETCIWVRDRATSPALAAHLDQTFEKVGVRAIDATGQRFDPAVHEAGATVAARAPAEDGIIARTETPGYADRGRLLRHPVVTVYRGQVPA